MTGRTTQPAHEAHPAAHEAHDRLAVAAFAAGDATGAELDLAAALVAACPACAELHRDLRAITAGLAATTDPATLAAVAPRPRDFRITAAQAARLRPAGWRRLLVPLAGPRFAFAAPLGTGLAAAGLAGILVAGAAGLPLGAGGSAAAPMQPVSGPTSQTEAYGPNAGTGQGSGDGTAGQQAAPSGDAQDKTLEAASAAASEAPAAMPVGTAAQVAVPTGAPAPLASDAPAPDANRTADTNSAPEPTPDAVRAPDPAPAATSPGALLATAAWVVLLVGLALAGLRVVARRTGTAA